MMRIIDRILNILKTKDIIAIKTPVFEGSVLTDKKAIIIGGTGGIGEAISEAFIRNGCKIVVTGTNEAKMEEMVAKFGEQINCIKVDLRSIDELKLKLQEAINLLDGQVDILVNAAGIHGSSNFWEVSESDYDNVMDINLKAMFFSCQYIAKFMKESNICGHILNISSASALKPGKTPYEISKNAVRSLTLGISSECVSYGITVNAIGPGPVATNMLGKSEKSGLNWAGNPSGRVAVPDEIANWAVFLCSSMGDLVVGDTLYVSGGSGTICIDK